MAQRFAETERKYVAAAAAPTADPDLRRPDRRDPRLARRSGSDALYFDTADLALAARRITLRRRDGGADEGWHLKLPDRLRRPDTRTGSAATSPRHRTERARRSTLQHRDRRPLRPTRRPLGRPVARRRC